jgi:hypothetical protein
VWRQGQLKAHFFRSLVGAILAVFFVVAAGCVHTQIERRGRQQLRGGAEGLAQWLPLASPDFEEAAVIRVQATGITNTTRRSRHLLRRASLLGCDGVTAVEHISENQSQAICLKRIEPKTTRAPLTTHALASTPKALQRKLMDGGDAGIALLHLLNKTDGQMSSQRDWSLRWYLKNYPESPFQNDVRSLFIQNASSSGGSNPPSIRTAPQAK